jgi:hypothetical protein
VVVLVCWRLSCPWQHMAVVLSLAAQRTVYLAICGAAQHLPEGPRAEVPQRLFLLHDSRLQLDLPSSCSSAAPTLPQQCCTSLRLPRLWPTLTCSTIVACSFGCMPCRGIRRIIATAAACFSGAVESCRPASASTVRAGAAV